MLLEGGLGDAYGAGFEFEKPSNIERFNTMKEYRKHPKYDSIFATYTDDTQMAIAISELLLNSSECSDVMIADKFVEVFQRDPRRGYSSRFFDILEKVSSGKELLEVLVPYSNRNGAAMRSYPLGILKEESAIIKKCKQQAQITHDTEEGILSSQIIALAAHFFIYKKGDKKNLSNYLKGLLPIKFDFQIQSTLKMEAIPTVSTVIYLVIKHNEMKAALLEAVSLGGDTDTVASLVIALFSRSEKTVNDFPTWIYDDFEDEVYGKRYLMSLDKELFNKFL